MSFGSHRGQDQKWIRNCDQLFPRRGEVSMVTQERTFHGLQPESDIEHPNGAALEQKVADALASAGNVSPSDITVVDLDGDIYLRGNVSSQLEADNAGDVATAVNGVKAVINEIKIQAGRG
jgi:osmotically-inducible protein OsmY